MPWKCGECGGVERDELKVEVLCHHCGKPLCLKHGILIRDDVFVTWETHHGDAFESANHCEECKKFYHPKAKPLQA